MRYFIFLFFIFSSFSTQGKSKSGSGKGKGNCKQSETEFKCLEVIRVYDGDTITVNIPNIHPLIGQNINIRIKGVDTPEIRTSDSCEKEKAIVARDYVKGVLMQAKDIRLTEISKGKYFRIVGNVIADDVSIADQLLNKKLAYRYTGGKKPKINWCDF
jgi:endonuclease YncB( thermonuclease family)